MEPKALIEAYRDSGRTLAALARAAGVRPQYINDVRAGRHRLSAEAAKNVAAELRLVGLIPDSALAELEFQLAGRNMPVGATTT